MSLCSNINDIEDDMIIKAKREKIIYKLMLKDLLKLDDSHFEDANTLRHAIIPLQRRYKYMPSKQGLGSTYRELIKTDPINYPFNDALYDALITKAIRSDSGIINVSVSMPPDRFSCKYNCHFCPNEPGMPRSYLSNEDVFMRAKQVDFDTVKQVYSRLDALEANGHPIDKLEFRVLGGTFSCYDHQIADEFIRDLYYAANTYFENHENEIRPRGSIEEEQFINITAKAHVVGLGVETRPDEINESEIIRFRRYGVTRVELGVQHTDDNLLRKLNRGHGIRQSKRAIKLLKDYGFKIEIHIMADLPGATPEGDMDCYRQVLKDDPDLIPDYMKDYPCLDVSYTKVKEWKQEGTWKPYSEQTPDAADLKRVLIFRQEITPRWVRVNRIQRDFRPATEQNDHLGYTSESIKSNLAQIVKDEAEKQGIYCQCIRCSEIRNEKFDPRDISYMIDNFTASGGTEYFISAVIPHKHRNLLLGFIRLRISNILEASIIPELRGKTAMIRELHVYGRVKKVDSSSNNGAQHLGIGKHLLQIAESISKKHKMNDIAIISGIGVRDYYRKQGYDLRGTYMMKTIDYSIDWSTAMIVMAILIIMISMVIVNFF